MLMRLGAILALAVLSLSALSQTAQVAKGRPMTVSEKLRNEGIGVDHSSLIAALANPNSEIRRLSAAQLGEMDDREALAALVSAMNREKDSDTEVTMAFSVSRLGDQHGINKLKTLCDDDRSPTEARLLAASSLQTLGQDYCRDHVKKIATSASNSDSRTQALYILTTAASIQSQDLPDIRRILRNALRDQSVGVRLAAASLLVRVGDQSDAESIKSAIDAEKDKEVRSALKDDLEHLIK